MQLYTIHTGFFKLDGGAMFGVVPKSLWSKVNPPDENNLCTWAMRCMLIEEGGKLILVDNGIGDKQDERFFRHYYLHGDDSLDKSLAAHGFHRSDITDVLLTHLHFDHCGGSIVRQGDKLVPAFPNATYWSHSRHWKWATEPNPREKASFLKENILPIEESGQLRFVDAGSGAGGGSGAAGGPESRLVAIADVILPGLSVRLVNGHTDAMMLPQVEYKGKTLVFMADLLPSTGHFPIPWVMAYDMFPLTSLYEKNSFLEEAVAGGYVLFFEHDAAVECCMAERTEKGIRPGAGFRLAEL
ncbi:MBL fold metallo-hydrolase [Puia dinghuensis]|uniref:MBL fold metallo-hydrolase n=1 Tax=Puia dinghuensis TaxID=1792502 RepID=A0A8J2UEU9_9BACT|nr:MBL fold metallo-hydrolase [Puia dinghuensis]GGB06984.1 MBL fold metallo-hydrolase [Puia dinghuensis]